MKSSIVDSVEKICEQSEPKDSQYLVLKKALEDYHQMIDKGILVPRGNTLQNIYTTVYIFPNENHQ